MPWTLFLALLILSYLSPSNAKVETSTIEKSIENGGQTYQCTFDIVHDDEKSELDMKASKVDCTPTSNLPTEVKDVELEDDEGHTFMVDFQMSPGKILQAEYEELTPEEEFQAQEIVELDDEVEYPCGAKDPRMDNNITSFTRGAQYHSLNKWPNAIIPYVFDYSFNRQDRLTFAKAVAQIEANTCIRFRKRRSEKYWLKVIRQCNCKGPTGPNCFGGGFANLGALKPSKLTIGAACIRPDSSGAVKLVAHELLHNVGIMHTQTRRDRGNHIWVYKNRIQPSGRSQFDMCTKCELHGTPYDCRSIMHYRDWAFQINRNQPVMVAKNPSRCDVSSPAHYLTAADNQLINAIYKCGRSKPTHGRWSHWSAWSTCKSKSQYRYRLCNNPKPANGGNRCPGKDKETRSCGGGGGGGGGNDCKLEEGKNTRGRQNQELIKDVQSWADCAALCAGKSGCTYWTWHHEGAGAYRFRCVLMKGYSSLAWDDNAISGNAGCATTDDGDCPEKDTNTRGRGHSSKINTNTWQECAAVCKKIPFCTDWTWHHQGAGFYYRRCIIMAGFGNKVTDTNAISGNKKCLR